MAKKGTVTELSSLFPAEDAHKASMRVQDEIAERRRQLDLLKGFLDDNTNLINLVWKLPDETHHNIMVPFGKAAFFPGRMTNPNKFVVLLGDSYYAERSSKQTVEILKRRSNTLETQIESLKAVMDDLKLEASFFDNTARESAEGLVEIREDYIEEAPTCTSPSSGCRKSDSVRPLEVGNGVAAIEDEEYARIFSRIAELELEEEEAEKSNGSDQLEPTELEKEEEEAEKSNGSDQLEPMQNEQDHSVRRDSNDKEVVNIPAVTWEAPVVSKEGPSQGDSPASHNAAANKDFKPPRDEKKIGSPLPASNTAFTGSIVEHAHNIGRNAPQQQAGAPSSKPVSRFKMQRKQ